jgi:fatty acid desaturase
MAGVHHPYRRPDHRQVDWHDLVPLSRTEAVSEMLVSLPWLAVSLWAASRGWLLPALAASFMFFLTGLRQVHGAFHYSVGLSRRWTERLIFGLSVVMLGSMHAIQITHLRHHRHCLDDEDDEAVSARLPAWKAMLLGPVFPIRLHRAALMHASARQRRWIWSELAATVLVILASVVGPSWLRYHTMAMLAGHCLTSFFAVWTVHHDCERDGLFARTMRGALKSRVTYHMFYHVEHHLFPAVPTRRLATLARRLDAVSPEMSSKRVF